MPLRAWWPAVALAALLGCSKSPPPPQQPPPTGERITGTERIGWTQQATDAAELADFKYAIYVDGVRSPVADVSCGTTASSSSTGFDCTAPLPKMSAGSHSLEVAAYVDNGTILESPRSSPLQVIVSPAIAPGRRGAASVMAPAALTATTADGARVTLDVVARGLDMPTDLAAVPDGRLFVAERGGRIRIVRDGAATPPAATALLDRDDDESELLALAVDPHFDATPFVYAISATRGGDGAPTFMLARFRESHDTFADRAVLFSDVAASDKPSASLRFGADGKLYIALDDGGVAANGGDLATFNGKLLRLNRDGSTPDDQHAATPVYSYEYRSPRGFDWQPGSGTIWIADGSADGATRLSAVGPSAARRGNGDRPTTILTYSVPGLSGASSAAFYRGDRIPEFRGNFFLAADEGRHLLRIRFDPQNATRVAATERLFQDTIGGVRVVFVRADGTIYLCTAHELLRVGPAR